jgi:hypothetical protein
MKNETTLPVYETLETLLAAEVKPLRGTEVTAAPVPTTTNNTK